jgi:8-oxo-dGTP pyrophosphatase MutT (NUDIX family)
MNCVTTVTSITEKGAFSMVIVDHDRFWSPDPVAAAVLVPLYWLQDTWHVIFIRRSQSVSVHRGEISFPGGKREEGETAVMTACRETCEELGLEENRITVHAQMAPYQTRSTGFLIDPVIGSIQQNSVFCPSPREVAEILFIPCAFLVDTVYNGKGDTDHGEARPFVWQGQRIWGATAAIVEQFVRHFDHFLYATR